MAGGERLRLFCALRLPDPVLAALVAWQARHLSAGRPVPPDNLHVTLAFLGHRPAEELPAVARELAAAAAGAGPIRLQARRYRETRSVAMIITSSAAGPRGVKCRSMLVRRKPVEDRQQRAQERD